MANQDLFFDITKLGTEQEQQQYIISRVGDGGLKAITITVYSNGRPYNLTGLTPVFEGVKPDGERIIDTNGGLVLDARNGVFRYILPQQASTAEGEFQQAFFKLKRGEQTDSTLEIKIKVLKNKVEFGINSESYFTEYQNELSRLRTTVNQGIDDLTQLAEQTDRKINGQVESAKALDIQVKALQSSIDSNQLVTKAELTKQITQLTDQVVSFSNALENTKADVNLNVNKILNTKADSGVVDGTLSHPINITKSGNYYFDSTTQGLPVRNGNNTTGIIQAIMQDENNGILTILGSGLSIEKYRGQLYQRWRSTQPILLWRGSAGRDTNIELKDNFHNYGQLIFNITFYSNHYATQFVTIPENGVTLYFNNAGLREQNDNMKNGFLDEISILFKDERHLKVLKTLVTIDNDVAKNSNATVTAVYGIY